MNNKTKCFIINKSDDWQEDSVIENFSLKDDGLFLDKEENKGICVFKSFDSLEDDTVWHRLRLDADVSQNSVVDLRIYSSNSLYASIPGKSGNTYSGEVEVLIDDYLMDEKIPVEDKVDLFDYLGAKKFRNSSDLILFEFKGRYLWICIETASYGDSIIEINNLKIEFPRVSFEDHLPEIYRGRNDKNTFLSRFLSIFQSLYCDLEDEITKMPRLFDPDLMDDNFLNWVLSWFSIDNEYNIWGRDKLRFLLKDAMNLYKIKGTKESIKKIVEIYMGVTPVIIEQFEVTDNEYYKKEKTSIENLFGESGYTFSVIIKTDFTVTPEMYAELLKVINRFKPIDTICNLVILNDELYLDYHCYLGVNSYISSRESMVLDKNKDSTSLVLTNFSNV